MNMRVGQLFDSHQSTVEIPCEVYSRVSGYMRPVNQWNKGKQEEFSERKMVKVEKINISEYSASTRNFNTRGE